jgi:hypothetical protein
MHSTRFAQVFNEVINESERVLIAKADEYATDDERLHNFKVAAAVTGRNATQSLGGMMIKHTTSVYDMIEAGDPTQFPMDLWREKIGDHINYLILLMACVAEAYEELPNSQAELPLGQD